MKGVSLFSGIGGLDLGLERAGIEVILQVESDPFCQKVLAKHWPDVRRIARVEDVTAEDCAGADLIFGGFPCQPVSFAGKGLAQSDDRWLWPEMARLVREVGPRYVLVENVAGLLPRGFSDVLRDLAGMGFDAEWSLLSASSFGAPHQRKRLYILAYPHSSNGTTRLGPVAQREEPILPKGHRESFPVWLQAPDLPAGMDDGLPYGVYQDRGRAIGNAVVPQVAEWIGRRLMEATQ